MKQKFLLFGAAAFAALFLFSAMMLGRQLTDQKQSAEAFDNIAGLIVEKTESGRMQLCHPWTWIPRRNPDP